jgi:hypothetical protein
MGLKEILGLKECPVSMEPLVFLDRKVWVGCREQ